MTDVVRTPAEAALCSIERTLGIVGERWTFLILRQSLINGLTRFADFEQTLKIAPNILADRLATLVSSGVLERREYRNEGSRPRMSYHPTPAGLQLRVVLGALQQWGDDFIPPSCGATTLRKTVDGEAPVRVGFVADPDGLVPVEQIEFERTPSHPLYGQAQTPVVV